MLGLEETQRGFCKGCGHKAYKVKATSGHISSPELVGYCPKFEFEPFWSLKQIKLVAQSKFFYDWMIGHDFLPHDIVGLVQFLERESEHVEVLIREQNQAEKSIVWIVEKDGVPK